MRLDEIQIRDPFVLPVEREGSYYLFGTTDRNAWKGPGTGFDCFRSSDLSEWQGPLAAFRPPDDFWASTQFWAPEVHLYRERYYMLASFKAPGRRRGTQVLVSGHPAGPFQPWSDGPVTPAEWECLDGTLFLEADGRPWMVFCHEWLQAGDGTVAAIPLTADLRAAAGPEQVLFHASEAPWAQGLRGLNPADFDTGEPFDPDLPRYVTDGPFLHRTRTGQLLMLWSSFGEKGYAMGLAQSDCGGIGGPWRQDPEPLWARDGGHGMFFRDFKGQLYVTLHQPNKSPHERAVFRRVMEDGAGLRLAGGDES